VLKHVECLLGHADQALEQSTIVSGDIVSACSDPASTDELTIDFPVFDALSECPQPHSGDPQCLEINPHVDTVTLPPIVEYQPVPSEPEQPPPGPVTLLSGNAHCPDCTCDVSVADPNWPDATCRSMFDDDLRWSFESGLHLQDGASLTLTFPEAVQVDHIDLQQARNYRRGFQQWRGDFSIETFNNGVWTVQGHVDDVPVSQLPMEVGERIPIGSAGADCRGGCRGRFVFPLAAPVTTTQVRMIAGNPQNGHDAGSESFFRLEELQVYGRRPGH